jgi:malate dehydrogenase (oxaloacetate-decarboxylating)
MPTDLARNVPLDQLHYRHEILYFKVLAEQLSELMPVVYFNPAGPADARSPN